MFALLTFLSIDPDKIAEVKKIFTEQIVPVVKSQKGNIGIWLLEPVNSGDEYVSLTEWTSKADAEAYEAGGTYKTLVDKVKDAYTKKPVLKTYNIAESKVAVTM